MQPQGDWGCVLSSSLSSFAVDVHQALCERIKLRCGAQGTIQVVNILTDNVDKGGEVWHHGLYSLELLCWERCWKQGEWSVNDRHVLNSVSLPHHL